MKILITNATKTAELVISCGIPGRKKPVLAIRQGAAFRVYATFSSNDAAAEFADKMFELFGAGTDDIAAKCADLMKGDAK